MTDEQTILADELHKRARRNFQTRKTITTFINDLWQADLVIMDKLTKYNKGFRYYLAVIDTFSKVGYAEPVKKKNAEEVTLAFEVILKRARAAPKNLQTDQGTEFFNKRFKTLMEKHSINHYHTWSDKKAAIVERWNRTVKERIYKQFTKENTLNWINILQNVVDGYNSSKHSTIGMAPREVKESNSQIVRQRLDVPKTSIKKPKFKLNQWVRLSRYKNIFEKGYEGNWTEELFQIIEIKNTVPTTYIVKDERGEKVSGSFYEQELQATEIEDYFRIDKILQKRKNKDGTVDVKVTKKGHDPKYYVWLPESATTKL